MGQDPKKHRNVQARGGIAVDLTVLYQVSYGMYVAGAQTDGRPVGCVINTVCQITSENPILSICLNRDNYTYKAIRETGRFSVPGDQPQRHCHVRLFLQPRKGQVCAV